VLGLAVGEHLIEVSAEGHQPVSERHGVTAGGWTQVAVALPPASTLGTLTASLTGAWRALSAAVAPVPPWLAWAVALAVVTFAGVGVMARRRPRPERPAQPTPAPVAAAPAPPAVVQGPDSAHKLEPAMIALPGGEFWMGSPDGEAERNASEGPRHRVRIPPFGIGKYAVTFAQYDAFAQATGRVKPSDSGWGRGDRPVINVSWNDAVAYAAWLSRETGEQYRLPSEAEWEYAARAGTETPFWTGPCIHTDQANYDGNFDYNGCGANTGVYRQKTVPVGSLPANPWGLHEVHGNVREWVQDRYHDSYTGAPTDGSVWEVGGSSARVVRGGSWIGIPGFLRAAYRYRSVPVFRGNYLGFRLARTLSP
jgi:formylglycine-generating enzyme required for sulfatase activity